jgi:hypothetical protein
MPSDAAPVENETIPQGTDSGVEVDPSAVPQPAPQPVPEQAPVEQEQPAAPVAPAPEQIDGIY